MKSGGDLKSTEEDEEIQLAAASPAAAKEISLDAAVAAVLFYFYKNWLAFLHFKKNNVVSQISLTLPHHGQPHGSSPANISSRTGGCSLAGWSNLSNHLCPNTFYTRWKHEINIKDLGDVPSGTPRHSASSWPINTLDECHNHSINYIKPSKMLRLRDINRRRRKSAEEEIESKDVVGA